MDETTPHIHATLVPIVTGERRKAKKEREQAVSGKRQYRKKNPNAARLCADDVMARPKLKEYQDTYAQAMQRYGLQRGVEGSEARHITGSRFYRDVFLHRDEIREEVQASIHQRDEVREQIDELYDHRDEAREKYCQMERYVQEKNAEREQAKRQAEQVRQRIEADGPVAAQLSQQREIDSLRQQLAGTQNDLNIICHLFEPAIQWIKWAKFLQKIGFAVGQVICLFTFQPMKFSGKLYSDEHRRWLPAEDTTTQLHYDEKNPGKLHLSIDGCNYIDWCRIKYIYQIDELNTVNKQPHKLSNNSRKL